jgi:hypothetical protein
MDGLLRRPRLRLLPRHRRALDGDPVGPRQPRPGLRLRRRQPCCPLPPPGLPTCSSLRPAPGPPPDPRVQEPQWRRKRPRRPTERCTRRRLVRLAPPTMRLKHRLQQTVRSASRQIRGLRLHVARHGIPPAAAHGLWHRPPATRLKTLVAANLGPLTTSNAVYRVVLSRRGMCPPPPPGQRREGEGGPSAGTKGVLCTRDH